jgi:hypothetical protein
MKCRVTRIIVSIFLTSIPVMVFAGWQVAEPQSVVATQPFTQAAASPQQYKGMIPSYGSSAFPTQFANLGKPAAVYAISVSGSLKENIERIMDRYHWKVIWKVPFDYNFDGRVTGTSLPNVIEKLLSPFPLQATLYMSNRTMTVTPRKV